MSFKYNRNKPLPALPHIHFIGIGGIGMSSLAQWFIAHKWSVSGSDIASSLITADLKKVGVTVKIKHQKSHIPTGTILIIRSQAIRDDNAEVREANRRTIPILRYPEAVGHLTRLYRTVAVAGAHGKSTTTALAALAAMHAHADPTVIIGTRLNELPQKNFRAGKSDLLILEADEYGKAFLSYTPLFAIITTIDAEHLDTYGTLANVRKHFLKFAERILPGGTLILNKDDTHIRLLLGRFRALAQKGGFKVVTYSLHSKAAHDVSRALRVPGTHMLANALAVHTLADALGFSHSATMDAFRGFRGTWRRMELRGDFHGAAVYDDYAHHPTEIRATLSALRMAHPRKRIVCVFEPHQAERLRRLWREFHAAFADADVLVLAHTYRVMGRDHDHPHYNARTLAADLSRTRANGTVFYCDDLRRIRSVLTTVLPHAVLPQCVIVMMGAGTIVDHTPTILTRARHAV